MEVLQFMKLKEIRKGLGFTQKQACSYIGCSRTVYTRYETGTRKPSLAMLIRISDAFGVSLDYLVGHCVAGQITLSDSEKRMIDAFRSADARARKDAYKLLTLHENSVQSAV